MGKLSYAEYEAILLTYFGVQNDGKDAFRARLKQLRRLNLPVKPSGIGPAEIGYSIDNLLEVTVAVNLISAGMPASRSAALVQRDWFKFQAGFGRVLKRTVQKQSRDTFAVLLNKGVQSSRDIDNVSIWLANRAALKQIFTQEHELSSPLGSIQSVLRLDGIFRSIVSIIRVQTDFTTLSFPADQSSWVQSWDNSTSDWNRTEMEETGA